jgi:hypothetical protein
MSQVRSRHGRRCASTVGGRLHRRLALVSAAFLAAVAPGAEALAASPAGRSPWVGLGLGGGAFSGASGVAGHVDIGWGFGRAYVAGRLAGVADSLGCCERTGGDRTDAAAMLGLQRVTDSGVMAIGVGPAAARGQGFGDTSWGLGVEARLVRWGARGIGPGLYAFANINSRSSFFGLTVGIHFGGR